MMVIKSDKMLYVDIDDTLAMWDLSEHISIPLMTIKCFDKTTYLSPNQKNINTLKKFHKMGYTIILWSHTGAEWAEAIAKELMIEEYVTACMTKPRYYMDDKDCSTWMGQRIYRNAITGEDEV